MKEISAISFRAMSEPRDEDLDLALEVVELVVASLHVFQQLLVVGAHHHHRVPQHRLGHVPHPQGLAHRLPDGQGRLLEEPIVQVAGPVGIVPPLLLRHQRGDHPGRPRGEGQEEGADGHVEEGVGVGDLAGRVERGQRDQVGERADEREHERDPQHLERDVGDRHPPGIRGRAHARGQRGGAGADVGPQHHRERGAERQEPLLAERKGEADGRGRGGHARAQRRADQEAEERVAGQGHQHLAGQLVVGEGGEPVVHDLHAEEDEAEAEHHLPQALDQAAPPEEHGGEAHPHQQERQLLDPEGEELDGDGGADVGAQDHPERLGKGQQAGGDEADQHQGGGRRRLDDRGHQRARTHRGQPGAGHASEQVAEMAARRALQPLADELHAVEQQSEAPEEREEGHVRG
jgi:hypothetical protein